MQKAYMISKMGLSCTYYKQQSLDYTNKQSSLKNDASANILCSFVLDKKQ